MKAPNGAGILTTTKRRSKTNHTQILPPSKRHRRLERGPRAALGVHEGEGLGVELEAGGCGEDVGRGVELVAEDRVADRLHVHAELVAAAGAGAELDAGGVRLPSEHAPVGQRRAAALEADHLQRAVGPVADERELDAALVGLDHPGDAGDVGLADLAPLELPVEMALRELRAGKDHDAGGVHVEAVDEERAGIARLRPRLEAILRPRRLGRNAEEARGLVQDQEMCIAVDHHLWREQRYPVICINPNRRFPLHVLAHKS